MWRGILYEISGQHKDLDGFAKTRVPRNRAQPSDGNYGVYGIDGEMLFTTHGLQLCKGGYFNKHLILRFYDMWSFQISHTA